MRCVGLIGLFVLCYGATAVADAAAALPPPNKKVLSVIDEDPIPSPRANAMGGAIGTVADDLDAAFHNPAGIGGLNQKAEAQAPIIRKFYFPAVTVEANQHAPTLIHDLKKSGASNDGAVGQTVIDSHADERNYARANVATGMVLGRGMVLPFSDTQMATTPRGENSGILDTHYRNMNGIGYGLSVQSPDGGISLGYFGYAATRQVTEGALMYADIIDASKRKEALKAASQTYSGTGNNAGAIWRMNYRGSPTLGLNVKNAGDTTFKAKGGEQLRIKQDVQSSFSLSPHLGRFGVMNFVAEADSLERKSTPFSKKYHLGMELLLGKRPGSYSVFALRTGYTAAGPSAGLALHLGLIGFDVSVYSVDISADSSRVVERRASATAFVNVAEF
jgi:hypothetical protein